MADSKSSRDILGRFRVFMGVLSNVSDKQASVSNVEPHEQPMSEIWRHQKPLHSTSPVSIKRNIDCRPSSSSGLMQKLQNTDDISSDQDDLVSADSVNDADGSHVNVVFKPECEFQGECFVSAFGKRGRQVGEYQDAKHVTCLPDGRLIVTDYINSRLQICSNGKGSVTVLSSNMTPQPWASAVTKDNNIAVTVCKDRCVKIFTQNGELVTTFGHGYFIRPAGIATDKQGNFIVCDSMNDEVSMFDGKGEFLRYLGKATKDEKCFNKPCYVCVSSTDDIIVSDGGHHMIKVFDSNGNFVRSIGSFGKKDRQFKSPYGVCTNIFGQIFVADHYNSRIAMYTRDGQLGRHLVTSEHGLVHPQGLAISSDNHLYVTHGHLKASEILMFKLGNRLDYSSSGIISHV